MKCDIKGCKRKARWNIQTGTTYYEIVGDERYEFYELVPDDEMNAFRCEEHQYDG